MTKNNRFSIKKPAIDAAAIRAFAMGAELTQDETDTAPTPTFQPKSVDAVTTVTSPEAPQKKQSLGKPKLKVEAAVEYPWSNIDDKTAKPQAYSMVFPASIYAKMRFLGANEPGGHSIRGIVLASLDLYLDEKLKKHGVK